MFSHLRKRVFLFIGLLISASIFFACQKEVVPASHTIFLNKYKALLGDPKNKPLTSYHIPKNNIELNAKIEKLASWDYNQHPLLKYEYVGVYEVPGFYELDHIFKDGSLFFSDERAPDRDPVPIERKDKKSTSFFYRDGKLETVTSLKGDMAFSNTVEKIMVNDRLTTYYFDKLEKQYNYYDGKKTIPLTNTWSFPAPFSTPYILGPVLFPRAIGYTVYNWQDINGKTHSDKVVIDYKWKDKKTEKLIILPATDAYKPFHTYRLDIRSLDNENRLYLRLKADYRFTYQGMKSGHVMIYDMDKDTLYSFFIPFIDVNQEEELIDTHYVLGDDHLIYFQLVTDKAYHIFKIDPQWTNPGTNIDYDPVFFKFYPELRTEWDKN